jgi:tyrosine-protein kinase Etk/Wzc
MMMSKNQSMAMVEADEWDDPPPLCTWVDMLTWVGQAKKRIAIGALLATLGVSVFVWFRPDVYTARTTLLPPASQQQGGSAAALAALGSLGALAGGGLGGKAPDELYVSLLKSDTVWRALEAQFDLKARYKAKNYESLKAPMLNHIRVSSDKKSGLITVEVDDESALFAAQLANAHASEITKLLSRLAVVEAQQRRLFFEEQLKDTKENLIKAEQALRSVQEKSGMVALDKQAGALIEAAAQIKARIAEREVRLKVLRTTATAENPDVRWLSSELSALRAELNRMELSPTSVAGAPDKTQGATDLPIGQLPAAAVDYVRALREVKFQEAMLGNMLKQFEGARLDEAKDAPALQQVDTALPPDKKAKPQRVLLALMTALLSTLTLSGLVIWRRYSRLATQQTPEKAQAWMRLLQAWRLRPDRGGASTP